MIINAQVNQADVPRLKVGETVEVTVEAVPGLQATGRSSASLPRPPSRTTSKATRRGSCSRTWIARIRPGMTANVKIPVASAGNVTAVPLAAVFTEKNPDTGQMERFVYVQQGDGFEKRNVKVGVSDFFYAEIQEGLKAGEVVSLEMPKEELEKKAKQLAGQKKSGGEAAARRQDRRPRPAAAAPTAAEPPPAACRIRERARKPDPPAAQRLDRPAAAPAHAR